MKTGYANIITLNDYQDEKVNQYLSGRISDGEMIEYLSQWDYGDSPVDYEDLPCGSDDTIINNGCYFLYSNKVCGYVGLVEKVYE